MNYDIKISGNTAGSELVEFNKLASIMHATKDIATKALMLRLRGFSDLRPDKQIKAALDLRLQGFSRSSIDESTLVLDCDLFENTIGNLKSDLYTPNVALLQQTPMSLVIQSFSDAIAQGGDHEAIDRPLLKSLLGFQRNFTDDKQVFSFSNRNSIPAIEVTKADFKKIAVLEEKIPRTQHVIVNGQLDEMKFSKSRIVLITHTGPVNLLAPDAATMEGIVAFFGKEITISGRAHFKSNGHLAYIEIGRYDKPNAADKNFSRQPTAMTGMQQIHEQFKKGKKLNPFEGLVGIWAGGESDEEFEEALKDLD